MNPKCQASTPVTVAAGAASTLAVAGVLVTTVATLLGGTYGTGTKRGAVRKTGRNLCEYVCTVHTVHAKGVGIAPQ